MKNLTNNYQVVVRGTSQHITKLNRLEKFSKYEAAVTYFQEMCDLALNEYPDVTHEPSRPVELSEGGIGYDYRVDLEFINE